MKSPGNSTISSIFMGIVIFFSSCEIGEAPGIILSEERQLDSFEGIVVESIGDIKLHNSSECKIEITSNHNVLDDIKTYVSDNILHIQLSGHHRKIEKLEINIYTSIYKYIQLDGVADIIAGNGLSTDKLSIVQNGVGNITLENINIQYINMQLKNVGNILITGEAQNIFAELSGIGDFKLFDLEAEKGEIILSGTGAIESNIREELKINLSGVGSIFYIGNPNMSARHTGPGKIIQVL